MVLLDLMKQDLEWNILSILTDRSLSSFFHFISLNKLSGAHTADFVESKTDFTFLSLEVYLRYYYEELNHS